MLAIMEASGKLGIATLSALLDGGFPPDQIVALTPATSCKPAKWIARKGIQVRHASYKVPASLQTALKGVQRLFLISSPRTWLEFANPEVPPPPGLGREKDHYAVLKAAQKAGVKHIYYTSRGFYDPLQSIAMTAHARTEARLEEYESKGVFHITILRECPYNESWPMYLGYFNPEGDERTEIVLADEGDKPVSWIAISDLGLLNAMVLADEPAEWKGKRCFVASAFAPKTLKQIAEIVGKERGKPLVIKKVRVDEHIKHYTKERGKDENAVKWWSATYQAIAQGECFVEDGDHVERLQDWGDHKSTPIEETIRQMLRSGKI